MQKLMWFGSGLLAGLTVLSISKASVPSSKLTDDTALYQRLSEIHVKKEAKIDFDSDINQLARLEKQYEDKRLPFVPKPAPNTALKAAPKAAPKTVRSVAQNSRLYNPIQRVAQQKYVPSSKKAQQWSQRGSVVIQ